ncbi:YncE family protein, partial [Streptomyces sp. NPDC059835]|uniref:YncE family protein n=1 Tax=Streptomyces sp. NPDC059835 TaxID=3346967 RepID=UPI00364B0C3E
MNVSGFPQSVAFTPDGSRAYVTRPYSNSVAVINTATSTVSAGIPLTDGPYDVAASPDGKRVYVSRGQGATVAAIDTATNTVTATTSSGNTPRGVAVTPDGGHVYTANGNSATVSVIDTTTRTTSGIPVGKTPVDIAIAQRPTADPGVELTATPHPD